jgi:hypothetical protein
MMDLVQSTLGYIQASSEKEVGNVSKESDDSTLQVSD